MPAALFLGAVLLQAAPSVYAPPHACDSCHVEIARKYWQSNMGRSMTERPRVQAGTYRHTKSNRAYEVTQTSAGWVQRRSSPLPGSSPFEQLITHAIGSGHHAQSYLHLAASGQLTQLPLTWYAQGAHWAMSPGYDRPRHYDFARVVEPGCLFCHAAYPPDSARGPAGAIDCQRCHGPGAAHVLLAGKGTTADVVRASIVQPARLPLSRRRDVCFQCHLQSTSLPLPHALRKAGRGVFSFRPGEPLADYLVQFEPEAEVNRGIEINSHGYRLTRSACYQKASALTCTTCHDPHDAGAGGVQAREGACLTCHQRHAGAASGDCATCHMPRRQTTDAIHVSMTDHLIQRSPESTPQLASEPDADPVLRPKLSSPATLSAQERDYYLGVALASRQVTLEEGRRLVARSGRALPATDAQRRAAHVDAALAHVKAGRKTAARAALEEAAAHAETRAEALTNLAALYLDSGDITRARPLLQQTLAFEPANPDALNHWGRLAAAEGNLEGAIDAFRAALQLDPQMAFCHYNLGRVLHAAERRKEAAKSYRRALSLDPALVEARFSLGVLAGEEGRTQEAADLFRAVLRTNPNHAEARRNLALLQGEARAK